MPWTSIDEEKRLCTEWLAEPLINPETGAAIDRNGPTFLQWKERCKKLGLQSSPLATGKISWRKCMEWKNNRLINPDSGRQIKVDGPVYKWLEKQCSNIEKETVLLGEYLKPDCKGMVPCVKHADTFYVVRKLENRKVWGPLNKPAKHLHLIFYKDTYDYRNNKYKPVYTGGPPPLKNDTRIEPIYKSVKAVATDPKKIVDQVIDIFISKN